jgi:hypothetical protein
MCLVIGAIGVVGNLATVAVVAINVKLRKPYFLTILTLAIADLLGICFRIGTVFLEHGLPLYVTCMKPAFYVMICSFLTIETNCILQVVLIAVLKFLLLACPIKSRVYLRNMHIVATFFALWVVSACCIFLSGYFIMQRVKANEDTRPLTMGFVSSTTIPSILAIIVLHVVKVVKLRNSPALQKDLHTMNKVVSVILGIYIVYNVQKFMLTWNAAMMDFFHKSITVSAFIHHACNPLIYAAFSLWSRNRGGA